jgi:hypothetical protein
MGVDWADYKNDGRLALIATAYQHQNSCLYEQTAPGLFADVGQAAGIGPRRAKASASASSFSTTTNDGRSDVLVANGHAVDNIARTDRTTTYPQLPQLFTTKAGALRGGRRAKPAGLLAARRPGLCVGDVDNDGRVTL